MNQKPVPRLLSPPILALIFVLMGALMAVAIILSAQAARPAASKPPDSAARHQAAESAAPDSGKPPNAAMWGVLAAGAGLLIVLAGAGGLALLRRRAARQSARRLVALPQYKPSKIGNDASARPWESGIAPLASAAADGNGATQTGASWRVPPGFDVAGFTAAAGRSFIALQAAWDQGDLPALRGLMTDEMLAETRERLAERDQRRAGGPPGQTEVAMLDAHLLGIEELSELYVASVEFSGMLRENSSGLRPFRVIWNMTRQRRALGDWRVAGMQAMQ
ncbi:MAG: 39S ribosomal protein L45 [Burkholderiaceae bacterium]|jgi:predicted lipid-binding transport protein (Tim44 family)|nr:39S ribosomal protein L45 [Burkholderiaceae bacterium]